MTMSVADLKGLAQKQFALQNPMMSLWQTLADNFYPERADFTRKNNTGSEFGDNLLSSYPVMMRRDLGNALSAMLRDGEWFKMGINGTPDHEGQMWLDWASKRQYKIMYDRGANFVRATKEGDHDYTAFGGAVLSIEPNRKYNGLLFRTWHLRDCAWWEDENGQVCGVARKWVPYLRQLASFFGTSKLHPNMIRQMEKNQFADADIMHIHFPVEQYGDESRFEYVSIYLDMTNNHIIEKTYTNSKHYMVPRFQTVSGSAYAYSPAAITALPDSRMLQAMTHTLMEAGERYARPPLIGVGGKVISSAVDLTGDGITWYDPEYDERNGPALRPLYQDRGGFPIGLELRSGIIDVLASAFYINKLSLPDIGRDMTAYEVQERMKQYRRENLPLFAPIEAEYNGQLCEIAFQLSVEMGMLGSPKDIPESLREQDVVFKFESPLTESEEEKKANRFQQVSQALAEAIQMDPGIRHNFNFDEAFRDAVQGVGAPEKWLNPIEMVMQGRQNDAAQAQAQAQAEQAPNG